MPFQFCCPQGHMLTALESQMGQAAACPVCGMQMLIPTLNVALPTVSTALPQVVPAVSPPPPDPDATPFEEVTKIEIDVAGKSKSKRAASENAADEKPNSSAVSEEEAPPPEEKLWHIPCPMGHELETPEEMLNQLAACPACGAEFTLKKELSREAQEERQRKETEFGQKALRWAITAAIVVALGLICMAIYAVVTRVEKEPDSPPATNAPKEDSPPPVESSNANPAPNGEEESE